ncbi:MAG: hypothetical protein HQ596_03170 [Candidatus Saganbacteria bacterium]|nr:hypothetical protein [Candidatus Saganbacteria bacterium]
MTRIGSSARFAFLQAKIGEFQKRFPLDKFGFAQPFAKAPLINDGGSTLWVAPPRPGADFFDCYIATEFCAYALAMISDDFRAETVTHCSVYYPFDLGRGLQHNFLLVDGKYAFGFTPIDQNIGIYGGSELAEDHPLLRFGERYLPSMAAFSHPILLAKSGGNMKTGLSFMLGARSIDQAEGRMHSLFGVSFDDSDVSFRLRVEFVNAADLKVRMDQPTIDCLGETRADIRMTRHRLAEFQADPVQPDFDAAHGMFSVTSTSKHSFSSEPLQSAADRMLEETWRATVLPFIKRVPLAESSVQADSEQGS